MSERRGVGFSDAAFGNKEGVQSSQCCEGVASLLMKQLSDNADFLGWSLLPAWNTRQRDGLLLEGRTRVIVVGSRMRALISQKRCEGQSGRQRFAQSFVGCLGGSTGIGVADMPARRIGVSLWQTESWEKHLVKR